MNSPLAQVVRQTIKKHEMVSAGDRVGIAVSGGGDSVALLRILEELRAELGLVLCVIHFNHRLRGADAGADENFVATLAEERGVPFISDSEDVAGVATEKGWNLEDAGRRLRYQFFERLIAEGSITRVATAHTADDQAETVLARIIRGTGPSGLASIHPVRGQIIRPLLNVRRAELRRYLGEIGQEWREDSSNADTRRMRARVREKLLRELEKNFGASIVSNLCGLAELAQDESAAWRAVIDRAYSEVVRRQGEEHIIQIKGLLSPLHFILGNHAPAGKESRSVTRRIIRKAHSNCARRSGELLRVHVEQVIEMVRNGVRAQSLDLPGGVQARKESGALIFRPTEPAREERSFSYNIAFGVDGATAVNIPEIGRTFGLKVIDWPASERETRGVAVLDAERLRSPLVLRNWKPGDAYRPSGRQRPRKLVRMLMASGISRGERLLWPVLTSAGDVAWAARMPAADEFSANARTRKALCIVEGAG